MHEAPLTRMVRAGKRRLEAKGHLRKVEWRVPTGEKDERGNQTVTKTMIDGFVEDRPALDEGTVSTERQDDTVCLVLDPVAITDADTFRWGRPPHTYRIKEIKGIIQDAGTGVRFYSEIFVLRMGD